MLGCLTLSWWKDAVSIWHICSSLAQMKLRVLPPTDPLCKSHVLCFLWRRNPRRRPRLCCRSFLRGGGTLHAANEMISNCIKPRSRQHVNQISVNSREFAVFCGFAHRDQVYLCSSWPLNLNCWTITSLLDRQRRARESRMEDATMAY